MMRFFSRKIISFALLGIPLVLLGMAGRMQAQSPSLGEIARQNKTEKKAKIVIGDDDVVHSSDTGEPSASGADAQADATADAAADPAKTTAAAKTDGKDATKKPVDKDKPEVAELKKKIEKLKADQALYQSDVDNLKEKLAQTDDDFRRNVITESIENNQTNVDILKKQREEAEAQLQSIQKDDHKDPGAN